MNENGVRLHFPLGVRPRFKRAIDCSILLVHEIGL